MKRYFGRYGGQFVPETLVPALTHLEEEYCKIKEDKSFQENLGNLLSDYCGRPTPLYLAKRLSKKLGVGKIYLKREDLLHTGAHKINNAIGQCLLAKKMGKKRIIAETGAGQHGVATATAAALLGLECEIYMGSVDAKRQELNVFKMSLLGTKVNIVENGSKTLKDAINEALRDYTANFKDTHYLIGSALGPHPYPTIVRNFQSVIGVEAKKQILEKEGKLPDCLVACVGGGSNAIGLFSAFLDDPVEMIGVEAGGDGKQHAERLTGKARKGVLHGMKSYFLQDKNGQIQNTYSVSAGLDYAGVGPEHSNLKEMERAKYVSVTDDGALDAFKTLSQYEGISPALESAHAVGYVMKMEKSDDKTIIINLSGRGDKDAPQVKELLK